MKTPEHKTALDSARSELNARHAAAQAELDNKFAVLAMLPAGTIPGVCNWGAPTPVNPRAWINYSSPAYDPENKWNPVAVLRAVEDAGWKLIAEASLVKWDNYRRSMEPCGVAEAKAFGEPDASTQQPRKKFTDGDAVAPYWVIPCQFTKPDFVCFMLAPDGLVYRVSLDVPTIGAHIHARRVIHHGEGDWHFDSGSARLSTPQHWPLVTPHSRAFVDTAQGISGAAYFHADSAKKTASDALAFLLSKPAT